LESEVKMALEPEEIIPAIRRGDCRKIEFPGFANASYFADTEGQIYSLNNPREPRIVDQKMGKGLMWVTLFEREGYIRKLMVGEIIAHTFLERSGADHEFNTVIYKDGDPTNNEASNITWGTPTEQQKQIRDAQLERTGEKLNGERIERKKEEAMLLGELGEVPVTVKREEDPLLEQLHLMQQKLEDAERRENDLRKALEPFARFILAPNLATDMGNAVVIEANRGTNRHSTIRVQDFRMARRAFEDDKVGG